MMQLDAAQKKLVESKPHSISFIKGGSASGKTTAAVYKAQYLKNNYCLFENDNILIVVQDDFEKKRVMELYNSIDQWSYMEYRTLFTDSRNSVEVLTKEEVIDKFSGYSNEEYDSNNIIKDIDTKRDILSECIFILKSKYKRSKLLRASYIDFFIDEISWIKACNYSTIDDYQQAERIGRKASKGRGPSRLMKNSNGREVIYELFDMYNKKLKEKGIIDKEDKILFTLNYLKSYNSNYTHVIVDESEKLTKVELEIMKKLRTNKPYSSLVLILNTSNNVVQNGWLSKNRKSNQLGLELTPRAFWLRSNFAGKKEAKTTEEKRIQEDKGNLMFIENYEYHDIRHCRKYDFIIDTSNLGEVILNHGDQPETYRDTEVRSVPMYSDIAAGEPIYINDELESNFYIPDFWLKGMKECFILKVKGDSMIGADINDGDYVVIRKQYTAQNGDIVAADLDGSATLKRLSIKKEGATLMPENEKYKPISINEEHAAILGIAVGIIKSKQ